MPREEGFAVADTATDKLYDPKFRRLWRNVRPDEAVMNAAVVLHDAVQLASWQTGRRVTAEDAAPPWMGEIDAAVAALKNVNLLDDEGRIPEHAWLSWFSPAYARRDQRRSAGAEGGKQKASNAKAALDQSPSGALALPSEALPVRPSVRTVPSDPLSPSVARERGLEKVGNILPDALTEGADVARLQKLAEELTGQAYVMQNVHSGLGYVAVQEQLGRHHFDATERAWRQIANRMKAEGTSLPTLRQLVFGATELLNPIPRRDEKEARAEDEQARFDRRVARTSAELAKLRGEPT